MVDSISNGVRSERSRVLTWALWDTGAAGLNAIVVTFVFSVYLTGAVGKGLPGGVSPASWLGRALGVAGLGIALLAPLIGVWVKDPHRRRMSLTVLTGLTVALASATSLIRERPEYFWLGAARGCSGVLRSRHCPVQRDAASAVDPGELWSGLWVRVGGGIRR